jgi:hypothetical protein
LGAHSRSVGNGRGDHSVLAVKPYFEPEAYEQAEREAFAYSYTFAQVMDRDKAIRDLVSSVKESMGSDPACKCDPTVEGEVTYGTNGAIHGLVYGAWHHEDCPKYGDARGWAT